MLAVMGVASENYVCTGFVLVRLNGLLETMETSFDHLLSQELLQITFDM